MAKFELYDIEWGTEVDEDKLPGRVDDATLVVLDDAKSIIFHIAPSYDRDGNLDYGSSGVYADSAQGCKEVLGRVKKIVLNKYLKEQRLI